MTDELVRELRERYQNGMYKGNREALNRAADLIESLQARWLAAHDAQVREGLVEELEQTYDMLNMTLAERDALAAQLDAIVNMWDKRTSQGLPFLAHHSLVVPLRDILDTDPSSILAERDARMRAEGGKHALLEFEAEIDASPAVTWAGKGGVKERLRARAEQEHQPLDSLCSCPSGDGSLRWPCAEHPPTQPHDSEAGR